MIRMPSCLTRTRNRSLPFFKVTARRSPASSIIHMRYEAWLLSLVLIKGKSRNAVLYFSVLLRLCEMLCSRLGIGSECVTGQHDACVGREHRAVCARVARARRSCHWHQLTRYRRLLVELFHRRGQYFNFCDGNESINKTSWGGGLGGGGGGS